MFEGLRSDIDQLSAGIAELLTPQWLDPQPLCHFNRGSRYWELTYLPPAPQGTCGGLLALSRDGKQRFTVALRDPQSELPLWRDALHAVLSDSDERDLGWWTRLWLRVRGRRIECSRLITRDQTTFSPTVNDVDRAYVARLSGWRRPCVMIVSTSMFTTSRSKSYRSSSLRLLPVECQHMAAALDQHLAHAPAAKPLAPLPHNLYNQPPAVNLKLIVGIVIAVTIVAIASTVLPIVWLIFAK